MSHSINPYVHLWSTHALVESNQPRVDNDAMKMNNQELVSRDVLKLKEALKARGKTQAWLAERLNVSNNAVSKWFRTGQISRENFVSAHRVLIDDVVDEDGNFRHGTPFAEADKETRKAQLSFDTAARHRLRRLPVPRLDVSGGMGPGRLAPPHESPIQTIVMDAFALRHQISYSEPSKLAVVHGIGDSMTPTFKDGDLLLVDTGITEVKAESIYVLQREDELFIKRVQRSPDGSFLIKSDNPLYDSFTVTAREADIFRVCGRVLMTVNFQKV